MSEAITAIYMGRRWLKDKTYHAFYPYVPGAKLTLNETNRFGSLYTLKAAPTVVGGIYEAVSGLIEDGKVMKIQTAGMVYKGKAHEDLVAVWEVEDRNAHIEKQKRSIEAKAGKQSHVLEPIGRIRIVYKNLPAQDRLPFQLWLIDQLSKP